MKKSVAFFAALFLTFSVPTVPVVPAQMSVAVSVPVPAPVSAPMPVAVVSPALDRIGVIAAVSGEVKLTTFGQPGRIAQSGQAIFMGDEVNTGPGGHLQILLLDETVFTIGSDSKIIIDKFVYDPKSHAGEIKASIAKGVFRYVSGKIAAKNPDSVKVKLPTATLGFRGTIVGGSVGTDGQGLAALLGPGNNNDTGARSGSFTVDGQGGDHQDVNRTGFGVEVGADGGLSGVFQLSDEQINGLTEGLGGGQAGSGGGDGEGGLGGDTNMGALSGENNVLTGENGALMVGLSNFTDGMNDVSVLGAQEAARSEARIEDGITKTSELFGLTGTYSYSGSGDFYTSVSSGAPQSPSILGTVSASWDLNFDSQYLENVIVTVSSMNPGGIGGSTGFTANLVNVPFSDLPQDGNAIFNPPVDSGLPELSAEITFKNVNGQIAQQGEISVNYADAPLQNVGNGSFTAAASASAS